MRGHASSSSKKRKKIMLKKVCNWADENKSWVAVLRPLPCLGARASFYHCVNSAHPDWPWCFFWYDLKERTASAQECLYSLCVCVCVRVLVFVFNSLSLTFLSTWSTLLLFPSLSPVLAHLSLSSHSSRHVSQQLLGSDGWYQQCKTLTCSLVTDYPRALLCCSLNAYQHTVHAQA